MARRFDHLNHRTEYEHAADEAGRTKALAHWLEASHNHLEDVMERYAEATSAVLAKQVDETRRALADVIKRFDDKFDRSTEAILPSTGPCTACRCG